MGLFQTATREKTFLKMALAGPSGSGKAQPIDAKILTPVGWTTMGSVVIGDKVIGSDGKPHCIVGVFPQGEKDVFRVIMSDGSSTECCDDHLWFTSTIVDRYSVGRSGSAKPLFEIRGTLLHKGKRNHKVPMVKPIEFHEIGPLPVDPYLLGVFIGDGHLNERFTNLTNPEPELQEAVAAALPTSVYLRPIKQDPTVQFRVSRKAISGPNEFLDQLRSLGLSGHLSTEKFIPEAYLFGSIETRVAVLQGLLDTDGYTSGMSIEYSTSSPRLMEDYRFLVESLGGTVTVLERMPVYKHNGERRIGAKSYRVFTKLPASIKPFRLSRKANRYIPATKYHASRFIESVEYVGKKICQCITVDADDSLYVTDHCIVTHNSYTMLRVLHAMQSRGLGKRIAVIETEAGKIEKYAGYVEDGHKWTFEVGVLSSFGPQEYIAAIEEAQRSGFDLIGIDSISHEWQGSGGVLELVDQVGEAKKNQFAGWKVGTPAHNKFIETILRVPAHIVATVRLKMDHILCEVEKNGRKVQEPRKVGLAPIQRNGLEYEFEIFCSMDESHILRVDKTICPAIDGTTCHKPGEAFFAPVFDWLTTGEDIRPTEFQTFTVKPEQLAATMQRLLAARVPIEPEKEWILKMFGVRELAHLSHEQYAKWVAIRVEPMISRTVNAAAAAVGSATATPTTRQEHVPNPPAVTSPQQVATVAEPAAAATPPPVATPATSAPSSNGNGHAHGHAPIKSLSGEARTDCIQLWEEFAHLNGWDNDTKTVMFKSAVLDRFKVAHARNLSTAQFVELQQALISAVKKAYQEKGLAASATPF